MIYVPAMNLQTLGFDAWFQRQADALDMNGLRLARVVAVDREHYLVQHESGVIPAEITGRMMFSAASPLDYPTVGDWVKTQLVDDDAFAVIHAILPRKSLLKRKTAGKKVDFQLIGANIDTALVMQSLDGNFSLRRLERYLVMVRQENIRPVFLLSKSDLVPREQVDEITAGVQLKFEGLEVMHLSCHDDRGLQKIKTLLEPARTYCLLGSSGVGKTTLLNRLLEKEQFATRHVREKDGRGRHTTTRRQLIRLPGGAMLVDTPGMRELGNIDVERGIADTFDDIVRVADGCRYGDCTHTHEKGCAVLEALGNDTISAGHYQNYMKLQKESEFNQMSYLEKKRRDKRFGKMVKSILKNRNPDYEE
jgi:ribosome biogenesis GTPase